MIFWQNSLLAVGRQFFFVADDQELQLEKDKIKTLNGTVVYWVVLRWCVSLILTPIFSSQNPLFSFPGFRNASEIQ